MGKVESRKKLLERRLGLSADEVFDKSGAIAKKIIESDFLAGAGKVFIYLPIKNEVDTKPIINFLVEAGINTYLPKSFGKEYKLVRFKSWNNLEKGPYGILEPKSENVIDSSEIDLAFIPGIAFDKTGVRLGYGKGVFDRLFAKSGAKRVGLAFEFQMVAELPQESHDLVMDFVITDEEVYRPSQPL